MRSPHLAGLMELGREPAHLWSRCETCRVTWNELLAALGLVGHLPTLFSTANDNFFSRLRQVPMTVCTGQFEGSGQIKLTSRGQADRTLGQTRPCAVRLQL